MRHTKPDETGKLYSMCHSMCHSMSLTKAHEEGFYYIEENLAGSAADAAKDSRRFSVNFIVLRAFFNCKTLLNQTSYPFKVIKILILTMMPGFTQN